MILTYFYHIWMTSQHKPNLPPIHWVSTRLQALVPFFPLCSIGFLHVCMVCMFCFVAVDLLNNLLCTWHHAGCFQKKEKNVGNSGEGGCCKPWNLIIFPRIIVFLLSNYITSYIHRFLPIMCFISDLHHVSKNPLICDLGFSIFSFVFLHNRRHPNHPPVIPGVCRCEFGTLCKPFFGSGEVNGGHSYRSSSYVFGCPGLHNILPYVLNCKQQRWHARIWNCIVIDPRMNPFRIFHLYMYIWAKRKRTNKNTCPPRN